MNIAHVLSISTTALNLLRELLRGEPVIMVRGGRRSMPMRELRQAAYVLKINNGYVVTREGVEAAKGVAA